MLSLGRMGAPGLSEQSQLRLAEIAEAFGLQFIRVFGSYAERPEAARDVDLVIDRKIERLEERARLESDLQLVLGKPVDLVELAAGAPPLLARQIGKHSSALWERDGTGRARYAELLEPLLAIAEDERLSLPPELRLVAPEVLLAKIHQLQGVLADLLPNLGRSREEQESRHYEIERQVQLAADFSAAIARRMLVLQGDPVPETARETFAALEKAGRIEPALSKRLQAAVGLRNLPVHEYGQVDSGRFLAGLKEGYGSFVEFARSASRAVAKPGA